VKEAYIRMGFEEVEGPIIVPSFWNFDYLFTPQDHPARDMMDTFFLKNPKTIQIEAEEKEVRRIGRVHRKGWKEKWNRSIASAALLRTHNTAVSAMQIHSILSGIRSEEIRKGRPLKFFTVGRVFRNENIDYRHYTEFYQTDGIMIGKDITISNLFWLLEGFYKHFGIKVKFVPVYFPFVEPGVEVRTYYEERGEWLELGGAGMVRQEITGIRRKKVRVLAWGLGLERILMIRNKEVRSLSEIYEPSISWISKANGL
ncbi:MAG: phenylalanine--tRNA ligase subunit alpha, partial [Candidatus Micrarchaeaceae archaeon]